MMKDNKESKKTENAEEISVEETASTEAVPIGGLSPEGGVVQGSKRFAFIGIIIAVLAVTGVVAAMNSSKISNTIQMSINNPEEYYRYVEKRNRDLSLEYAEKTYASAREELAAGNRAEKVTCRLEPGDTLKALANVKGMESATLVSEGKQEDSVFTGKMTLLLNDKNALSANAYLDSSAGEAYLQLPELTESYLDLTNTIKEGQEEAGLGDSLAKAADFGQNLPEAADITTELTKYSDIFIDHMENVERCKDTLSAGGIEKEYTRLDVRCDEECGSAIAKEMLETLQDDKLLKDIMEKLDADAYQEFQRSVTDTLADMEAAEQETAEDAQMLMNVFVDARARIVGRRITLATEEESFTIQSLAPRDGKEFGYDFSVLVDDILYFNLTGSGTIEQYKISGDFSISVDESLKEDVSDVFSGTEDIVQISVKDLELEALYEEGICKGEFVISSEKIPKLAGYRLEIKTGGSREKPETEIDIMAGSDRFMTLTIKKEEGEDPGVEKPDENAVCYDFSDEIHLATYTSEIDIVTFLTELSAESGVDLSAAIAYFMG